MFQISKADNKEMRGLKWSEDEYGIAFNRVLARHILQERHRHGGDFVVAWANADTKEGRDAIRKIVGPELIFVVLTTVDQSLLENRLKERGKLYDSSKKPKKLSPKIQVLDILYGPENENTSMAQIHDEHNKVIGIEVTDEKIQVLDVIYGSENENTSMAQIHDEHNVIEIEVTDEMKVENVANVIVELVDYVKQKKSQDRFLYVSTKELHHIV